MSILAASRRALLDDFAKQPQKRWFALSLADFSIFYLSIFLYYLSHIITYWNLPFEEQWYHNLERSAPPQINRPNRAKHYVAKIRLSKLTTCAVVT
ncbi:MAG: hypothetical protein ACRC4K_15485 [Plesiomonas shigelloides]